MSGLARAGVPATVTGHLIRDSSLGLVGETLDPILDLQAQLWSGAPLRAGLVELIRLRSARAVNCVICKAVRYDVARADGVTEQKVASLTAALPGEVLDEDERLVVAFTDAYLSQPAPIAPELAQILLSRFSPAQIAHMAMAIGFFNPMSKCAVSLSGMPESFPLTEISVPPR
jgi:AhpD family alkylhydroperoxidase